MTTKVTDFDIWTASSVTAAHRKVKRTYESPVRTTEILLTCQSRGWVRFDGCILRHHHRHIARACGGHGRRRGSASPPRAPWPQSCPSDKCRCGANQIPAPWRKLMVGTADGEHMNLPMDGIKMELYIMLTICML